MSAKYDAWPEVFGKNYRGSNGGWEVEGGRGYFGSDFMGAVFPGIFFRGSKGHRTDFLA